MQDRAELRDMHRLVVQRTSAPVGEQPLQVRQHRRVGILRPHKHLSNLEQICAHGNHAIMKHQLVATAHRVAAGLRVGGTAHPARQATL